MCHRAGCDGGNVFTLLSSRPPSFAFNLYLINLKSRIVCGLRCCVLWRRDAASAKWTREMTYKFQAILNRQAGLKRPGRGVGSWAA